MEQENEDPSNREKREKPYEFFCIGDAVLPE
jgi:hypothetical protein